MRIMWTILITLFYKNENGIYRLGMGVIEIDLSTCPSCPRLPMLFAPAFFLAQGARMLHG